MSALSSLRAETGQQRRLHIVYIYALPQRRANVVRRWHDVEAANSPRQVICRCQVLSELCWSARGDKSRPCRREWRLSWLDPNHQVSQQTQNICMTFVQCWTIVEDVGPTLYKCYKKFCVCWDSVPICICRTCPPAKLSLTMNTTLFMLLKSFT